MIHIKALGLEVRQMLGSGSFAQVYECYDHSQKKEYAVKMIKKEGLTSSRVRAFFKQAEILQAMDHKNIVKFYSFHQTEQYLLIKMELIRGGTLRKLIEKRKANRNPFKQEEVSVAMKNLFEGIRYLHNLNVIHRDLKIENILFADDNDLSTLKIVDFGLSAKLEINSNKNVKAQCGTLLYMAPQMFSKPSYTKSVDIWSCAVIMFMMFKQGAHPYYVPGMKNEDFKYKLRTESFPVLQHPLAQNFIQKISKKEYEQRYNVNQALKHPWITRNKDDQIPLSIHESFKGFDSANQVITMLKLTLALGSVIPHKRPEIDQFYRFKVKDFASNNEAVRVYSPSRRKVRDKNNELFVKMKKMFTTNQMRPQQSASDNYTSQECSPTLKKHDHFFTKLFQRQRPADQFNHHEGIELKKIQFQQGLDVKGSIWKASSQRKKVRREEEGNFRVEEQNPLSKTVFVDHEFMARLENEIEESVNYFKLKNMNENGNQRRKIFAKKSSFEEQEILGQRKMKLLKKYSGNYQSQRMIEDVPKKSESSSYSSKQIYNRKPMSPLRNQYGKPMTFSMSTRPYSQSFTGKKSS